MINRIYGLCEAAILALFGVGILWFALGTHYGVLMNVKFRWLTVTGAAMLLLMGVFALGSGQRRSWPNSLVFGLMILAIWLGKPYLPDANSMSPLEPALEAGLWDQVDQARFPRRTLQNLFTTDLEAVVRAGDSFTTIGVVKRLEALDAHESFALMTSMMFCCIADALAVGFRVPAEDLEDLEDGQWIMVCARFVEEEEEIVLPNFRFGRATMSSVHKRYYLMPERIMSYNRIDQLPLLTDQLSEQTNRLFSEALRTSGLWQTLAEEGPFTVFVPVDQALEALSLDTPKQMVSSHIVRGKLFARDLMERDTVETLNGQVLQVELANGKLRVNQSRLLLKDTEARNGVIHYIYPAVVLEE